MKINSIEVLFSVKVDNNIPDLLYCPMRPTSETTEKAIPLFYHPTSLEHDTGSDPENVGRLRGVLSALAHHGVSEESLLRPQAVNLDLLSEVHDPRYIAAVEKAARSGGGYWDYDTYISTGSYEAAIYAAGAAVAAVDAAVSGASASMALVRPPGHHALYASAMGFCLFNNVAVAAQHAIMAHKMKRVLIVDWDVHHGNGTQDCFYKRSDVLFFSTHQYPFYPGTGAVRETGDGVGKGYTVNVPLPAGVDDAGYKRVFEQVLVPFAKRYRPQLILISAGYDAHIADPIGGMAVSTAGFYGMARTLRDLADEIDECHGRVAAVLEGGYNIEALGASVLATIAGLQTPGGSQSLYKDSQGAPPSATGPYRWRPAPDVGRIIEQVRQTHDL